MFYRTLADGVVILHFTFVVFVVLGGVLSFWRHRILWVHLPAAVWGITIEFTGWICPLTPLENQLRIQAGETGYSGGFIEHYVLPVLYPDELLRIVYPDGFTRSVQFLLGIVIVLFNAIVYWRVFRTRKDKLSNR
ncbi:MAG: DUF2784 domain-containing protein [Proteobacteria bacterium]|nr:DUF2784 domain-containing protein [Pseudomonadota bacterium]